MVVLATMMMARVSCAEDRASPATTGAAAGFSFPSTGVRVPQQAVLLAIDDQVLPWKSTLCYYMSKPDVRQEPVLRPSRNDPRAPDYLAAHFYGTVLHDQGRFRMWYYAIHRQDDGKAGLGPVCYAESDNGLDWRKPPLGQVVLNGSRQNNGIALPGVDLQGVHVIKDEQDPDPRRRYKMIYQAQSTMTWTIHPAVSPDGIAWTPLPLPDNFELHEQCSFYRFNGFYYMGFQQPMLGEGGRGRMRQGYTWVSPDFDHWIAELADAFLLPEPQDNPVGDLWAGWKKPCDQVHLGVGAASFGNVVVGLYGLWHERGWGAGGTTCDLGLVVSNDGIHFREPVKGSVYLDHADSPATYARERNLPTILCQSGGGILNVAEKTYIYHGRWANLDSGSVNDEYAEVGLATLPRDRWGALGLWPGKTQGAVWSAPITLPPGGCDVVLNADGASAMQVEISDERFTLLPEYSGQASGTAKAAGGLDCPVAWPTGKLTSLGGKTVRLRIHLRKSEGAEPRLYAVYLTAA
jgi:hypothetical protein